MVTGKASVSHYELRNFMAVAKLGCLSSCSKGIGKIPREVH